MELRQPRPAAGLTWALGPRKWSSNRKGGASSPRVLTGRASACCVGGREGRSDDAAPRLVPTAKTTFKQIGPRSRWRSCPNDNAPVQLVASDGALAGSPVEPARAHKAIRELTLPEKERMPVVHDLGPCPRTAGSAVTVPAARQMKIATKAHCPCLGSSERVKSSISLERTAVTFRRPISRRGRTLRDRAGPDGRITLGDRKGAKQTMPAGRHARPLAGRSGRDPARDAEQGRNWQLAAGDLGGKRLDLGSEHRSGPRVALLPGRIIYHVLRPLAFQALTA